MSKIIQGLIVLVLLAGTYYTGARIGLPNDVQSEIDNVIDEGIALTGDFGSRFFGEIERDTEDWLSRFNESAEYEDAADVSETVLETIAETAAPETTPVLPPVNEPEVTPEPRSGGLLPSTFLYLCLNRISNAPPADDDNRVSRYSHLVDFDGVSLLSVPATKSCLSSGFGPRGSSRKLHKGIDLFSESGGDVLAAGSGTIVEALYRDDYGYMLVLDHGSGIYTRYAHLKKFNSGIEAGATVSSGQVLGPIGSSGESTRVAHLHYEVLQGDYNNPKRSFGLTALNPIEAFSGL